MAGSGGGHGEPPGSQKKTWADILGSSLPPSWNKNILEIVLEKDGRGAFQVSEVDCARLFVKIGLVIANEVDAVQICSNGRGGHICHPQEPCDS